MTGIERITQDIAAAPLGDIIASVGEGVAAAQQALDEASISATLAIYEQGGDERADFLREIGYRPTFYALPETTGEVTVSVALGGQANRSASTATLVASGSSVLGAASLRTARPKLYATPVDAAYRNRYDYTGNVAAKLSFKIVPVPAPNGLDEVRATPNFVGLSPDAASGLANTFDLVLDIDVDEESLDADSVEVISQSPSPGEVVTAGTIISVVVAKPEDE